MLMPLIDLSKMRPIHVRMVDCCSESMRMRGSKRREMGYSLFLVEIMLAFYTFRRIFHPFFPSTREGCHPNASIMAEPVRAQH